MDYHFSCLFLSVTLAVSSALPFDGRQPQQDPDHPSSWQLFRTFDQDQSGNISYAEFRRALASLNLALTSKEFSAVCAALDKDDNGQVRLYRTQFECPCVHHPALPAADYLFATADRVCSIR